MAEQTVGLRIRGIDCAECAAGLEQALAGLSGVRTATVLLGAEKAIINAEGPPDMAAVEKVLEAEGCSIVRPATSADRASMLQGRSAFGRSVLALLGVIVLSIVLVTVVGELLGVFELLERYLPWPIGLAIVLAGGYPVFKETLQAARRRQVTAGTLMTLGAVAATVAGQWPVGMVVMFFMRVSDYVERFTGEKGRQALRDLVAIAPQTALVERGDGEREVTLAEIGIGEIVVVRPGGKIPVDGLVVGGHATVDQATITGESMPVDVAQGDRVFAATVASGGSLRVRTERVGADTTFGQVGSMTGVTRRALIRALGGLIGPGGGLVAAACSGQGSPSGGRMGSATQAVMSTYRDLFSHHTQLQRTVEDIPGGVRTTTESNDPALGAQLQSHVAAMYQHLDRRQEVVCGSTTLPTLFKNAADYHRQFTLTPNGVTVTETSSDAHLQAVIRDHANEITGFVENGMPSMMRGMMGGG